MVLVICLAIGITIIFSYYWIKIINRIFNPVIKRLEDKKKRITQQDNPYVVAHRLKMKNDQLYDEYLQWLDKRGGDLPFEKWKTAEEQRFEEKMNQAEKGSRPRGGFPFKF